MCSCFWGVIVARACGYSLVACHDFKPTDTTTCIYISCSLAMSSTSSTNPNSRHGTLMKRSLRNAVHQLKRNTQLSRPLVRHGRWWTYWEWRSPRLWIRDPNVRHMLHKWSQYDWYPEYYLLVGSRLQGSLIRAMISGIITFGLFLAYHRKRQAIHIHSKFEFRKPLARNKDHKPQIKRYIEFGSTLVQSCSASGAIVYTCSRVLVVFASSRALSAFLAENPELHIP